MQDGIEKVLLKLAKQLEALDEASLMALWSKYATKCHRFEPTVRWEEAALVFSLIQAKRWKNQLFNYSWRKLKQPENAQTPDPVSAEAPGFSLENMAGAQEDTPQKPCRVLNFQSLLTESDPPEKPREEKHKKSPASKGLKSQPKHPASKKK